MAEFRLETPRLVLRDWREEDWPRFWQATDTPAVMRWLGGVLGEAGRAATRARVENCHAANGYCFWVVERRDDGEILGFCGVKRADAPGSTVAGAMEIGWRFREDSWGQGYAREAAEAALALGFERFGADRIVSLTVEGNLASRKLMERLGFLRRPALDYEDVRYPAELNPTMVHLLERDEWAGRDG